MSDTYAGLTRTKLVERLRDERNPEVLARYRHHPAWQVRWEAIQSLGQTGSPIAEGLLIDILEAPTDPDDLPLANQALSRVGTKAAWPALIRLIHHRVEDVKVSAIGVLNILGDSSLTPVYLDALSDRSWVAKWSAMAALDEHGDERAVQPVIDRLRQILGRQRLTNIGGWSEVMHALHFLQRFQDLDPGAGRTIGWVAANRWDRLSLEERDWFTLTFGRPNV
jgi:HEAT repeat protein